MFANVYNTQIEKCSPFVKSFIVAFFTYIYSWAPILELKFSPATVNGKTLNLLNFGFAKKVFQSAEFARSVKTAKLPKSAYLLDETAKSAKSLSFKSAGLTAR